MADDDVTSPEEERRLTRGDLLRKAGTGAVALSTPFSFYGPLKYKGRWLKNDLSIMTWAHFVPAFDVWLDGTWAKQWGEKNDTNVKIDHILNTLLQARAAGEVASQQGHDIFFFLSPPAQYEDQVIDHKEIVQQVQHKVGKIGPLARKSTFNPRTKKWFAFSDNYVPDPVVWRRDLWNGVGESPATWEHVRRAAPKLKAAGHPIGIGQSTDLDSNMALMAFMMCFGAYVQNEQGHVTLKSKNTVEAVKFMADIYQRGETDEIFGWDPSGNNNFLYSGKGSLILNAISATRTPEDRHLPFADNLWIWPIPKGPHGRKGLEHVMGCWFIWKFAKNKGPAKRFLADLAINYKQATDASKLYNFPSFPGAYSFAKIRKAAAADTHKPHGKYSILTTIAQRYTYNVGYPGYANAAIDDMFYKYMIPKMFAQVSQKKMSAADAVSAAHRDINTIFRKWRARGKI